MNQFWYFCCGCTYVMHPNDDFTCSECGANETVLIENQEQMKVKKVKT